MTNANSEKNSNSISQELIAKELYEKGRSKYSNTDYTNALSDFSESIRLNPKSISSYCQSALCLDNLNRGKEGIILLNKGIEIVDSSQQFWLSYALYLRATFKLNENNHDQTSCNDLKKACQLGSKEACALIKEMSSLPDVPKCN